MTREDWKGCCGICRRLALFLFKEFHLVLYNSTGLQFVIQNFGKLVVVIMYCILERGDFSDFDQFLLFFCFFNRGCAD